MSITYKCNPNDPTLAVSDGSGVGFIEKDGLYFKDCARDGQLHPFEDWPSGGPEEGGRDAHHAFGKYTVYPGKNFRQGMEPWLKGAFCLDGGTKCASAVMPYYTISWGSGQKIQRIHGQLIQQIHHW